MSIEHRIETMSTAELRAMLNESADLIEEIRAELASREAQARELESMDILIHEARPKLQEIRGFFALVLDELRERRSR
ncbi:hypothetical protein GCM10010082_28900 [Kushneria pakistanensis]|uniref:DUF904 domain-containing protein n=1 Tax=Kushneria pakistanensis TaxID=1508770 RepID=A0ABQ3FPG1_9GAMM|nr:hypothetical protein [Kushneria pakistanensis]GHC32633.1 hypothetical protein GCM10010082_28900 [Kushneria pakistanensis]